MTRNEANAWWTVLVIWWGFWWFVAFVRVFGSADGQRFMLRELPIAVAVGTGVYLLILLFRVTYLAGRKRR